MGVTLNISDAATPRIHALSQVWQNQRMQANRAAAEGALPVFQRRFVELGASNQNPFGARGTFWPRMLAGTVAGSNSAMGWVRMPREVAARRFGATIVPGSGKKFLALPAREESYGKSPRQFTDLQFIAEKNGGAMLVQKSHTHRARTRGAKRGQLRKAAAGETATHGAGVVMFWLVKRVQLKANPAVLPSDEEVMAGAIQGVGNWVSALIARGAGGAQ